MKFDFSKEAMKEFAMLDSNTAGRIIKGITEVVEKLTPERKTLIYRLAQDMLTAQEAEDFDEFTPEEIASIKRGLEDFARGDYVSFTAEELAARFGVALPK